MSNFKVGDKVQVIDFTHARFANTGYINTIGSKFISVNFYDNFSIPTVVPFLEVQLQFAKPTPLTTTCAPPTSSSKFKVGDDVRITNPNSVVFYEIGKITAINSTDSYTVEVRGVKLLFTENELTYDTTILSSGFAYTVPTSGSFTVHGGTYQDVKAGQPLSFAPAVFDTHSGSWKRTEETLNTSKDTKCTHELKDYFGLNEKYKYCTKCSYTDRTYT